MPIREPRCGEAPSREALGWSAQLAPPVTAGTRRRRQLVGEVLGVAPCRRAVTELDLPADHVQPGGCAGRRGVAVEREVLGVDVQLDAPAHAGTARSMRDRRAVGQLAPAGSACSTGMPRRRRASARSDLGVGLRPARPPSVAEVVQERRRARPDGWARRRPMATSSSTVTCSSWSSWWSTDRWSMARRSAARSNARRGPRRRRRCRHPGPVDRPSSAVVWRKRTPFGGRHPGPVTDREVDRRRASACGAARASAPAVGR